MNENLNKTGGAADGWFNDVDGLEAALEMVLKLVSSLLEAAPGH